MLSRDNAVSMGSWLSCAMVMPAQAPANATWGVGALADLVHPATTHGQNPKSQNTFHHRIVSVPASLAKHKKNIDGHRPAAPSCAPDNRLGGLGIGGTE
jgi:hypothetical protein